MHRLDLFGTSLIYEPTLPFFFFCVFGVIMFNLSRTRNDVFINNAVTSIIRLYLFWPFIG